MKMANSKSAKRAFVSSAIAVLLCVVMLIGTTFAWFTDTAKTGVNKIQSGTLDIELQMKDKDGNWVNAEGKTLDFRKSADAPEGEAVLWEPGCTYELPELRVVNNGNLALKYKIVVSGITGDAKLLEAIEFTGLDDIGDVEHLLPAEASSAPIKITGHMKEGADNEYQGLEADGVSVIVYATQYTHEYDSFGNRYDAGAGIITAYDELTYALATSTNVIKLSGDVDTLGNHAIMGSSKEQNVVLDMNGKTLGSSKDVWDDGAARWSLLSVRGANKTLTVTGNGEIRARANDSYAIDIRNGATVIIKDGKFIGNIDAVYVERGKLVVEGGFFDLIQKHPEAKSGFLLNCFDDNYKAGTASIEVKGGTFVNFNPADCAAEGAHTNFVAAGYKVVPAAQANGDIWYTVVAE